MNVTFSRVSLVVPEDRVLDVMETLLSVQATLRANGIESKLEVKHRLGGRTHDVPVVHVDDAVESVAVVPPVESPTKRNKVVYRVINPRVRVGQIPHQIRMHILEHGPRTAKRLEEETGLGRKSVESALHKLRTDGSVESVQDTGQEIKQRKFDARAIRMGAPVV